MPIRQRPQALAPQRRAATAMAELQPGQFTRAVVDTEKRTVSLCFATDAPVDMWYGTEILSQAPGAMRMGQRQQTLPLLFNHDTDDLLGTVERVYRRADGKACADVRFGKDERGEWAMRQCEDGVLTNVSFMYRVFKWIEDTDAETLTATDWEAYEISFVSVPADASAGVGRSASTANENGVQLETRAPAAAPQPARAGPVPPTPTESSMTTSTAAPAAQGSSTENAAAATTSPNANPHITNMSQTNDTATLQRGAEAERARITEVTATAKRYNLSAEQTAKMIATGVTPEQARVLAADEVLKRAKGSESSSVDFGQTVSPDLSAKEKNSYSLIRAANAAHSNDWTKAGFELECSNAIAKAAGRGPTSERGFFIPTNIPFAQRAPYAVGTPGAGVTGGTTVATNLMAGSFIEVLRNSVKVMQLGATMLSGLVGNVDIPRQTGQSSTFWTAEGVDTSESEATFDKVSLVLKTIGTYSMLTRNMLMQSTPDIDMIARADLMAVIARGIDMAALSGLGSAGQPLGIANQAGVGQVIGGANGAAITIDNLIDLETALTASNAPEDSLSYLANAKTIGSLKKLKATTGQYLWTNEPIGMRSSAPGSVNGYPVARTNQARSTLTKGTSAGVCSEVFFGAWSELLIGEWGVLEIVPNPYAANVFLSGGLQLRALASMDVAVRHAKSFAVMSDALTP